MGAASVAHTDNDWILPDPSAMCPVITPAFNFARPLASGDTSTNGVFVNDANEAVSAQGPYELKEAIGFVLATMSWPSAIDEQAFLHPTPRTNAGAIPPRWHRLRIRRWCSCPPEANGAAKLMLA